MLSHIGYLFELSVLSENEGYKFHFESFAHFKLHVLDFCEFSQKVHGQNHLFVFLNELEYLSYFLFKSLVNSTLKVCILL